MTNAEALKRAIRALYKAWEDTESFDHGGLASHEVLEAVTRTLKEEFATRAHPQPGPSQ